MALIQKVKKILQVLIGKETMFFFLDQRALVLKGTLKNIQTFQLK